MPCVISVSGAPTLLASDMAVSPRSNNNLPYVRRRYTDAASDMALSPRSNKNAPYVGVCTVTDEV